MQLSRAMLNALLPPGTLWAPQDGEGLDGLLNGVADCLGVVRADLLDLAHVRAPLYTAQLADLEREYGVIPRADADEETRRTRLAAVKAAGSGDGSLDFLQARLTAAGFDVRVHANTPAVDPGFFVRYTPSAIFGNDAASFGASAFGAQRGELLVNGATYYAQSRVVYEVPTDPGYWPLFFFVAGEATRDGGGRLTDMADARVPAGRRGELASIILKCKPLHSWAGLRIQYV